MLTTDESDKNEINTVINTSMKTQTSLRHYSVIEALEIVAPILPIPVYWHDKNGTVLGINNSCLHAMGATYDQVVGNNPYHFHSKEVAEHILSHNEQVMQGGQILSQEEIFTNFKTGSVVYAKSVKAPLYDDNGNVIGIIGASLDMTAEKEAERLQLEAERLQHENEIRMQRLVIEEKEKLITLANTVAHDIASPLSALAMMMECCNELPENKRSMIRRATESILDITNNLLGTYRNEEPSTSAIEHRQSILISDLIVQLLSEKRMQYHHQPIKFQTDFASSAHFAFVHMQKTACRRAMSNLINNAVDALAGNKDGVVTIQLTANANSVIVVVKDNGKGMSRDNVDKMLAREGFTEGKENGHGLGLQQVWDTLGYNQGAMSVQSTIGEGTSIQLTFPRVATSSWIAQKINLLSDHIIVILDDDESIHTAWDLRFASLVTAYPLLRLHHFTLGQEALNFFGRLNPAEKERVFFLSDYELLHQDRNGLQIIEASQLKGATLVTSYYADPKVREIANKLNVKMLPKQMASVIPIDVQQFPISSK